MFEIIVLRERDRKMNDDEKKGVPEVITADMVRDLRRQGRYNEAQELVKTQHQMVRDARTQVAKEIKSKDNRIYNNDPENKARRKAYQKKYASCPINKVKNRARVKAYQNQPGMKEKIKAYQKKYHKKPEVIAKQKVWQANYGAKPEVKERHNASARKRYWEEKKRKDRITE